MDSAVAGLRAHQNKLDVIGNNIANVNTQGFKAQNYTFKDAMYQTETASTKGLSDAENNNNGAVGGANPAQYGYGSLTGAISTDMTSGTPTYLGGFNACIDGPGFFVTTPSLKAGQAAIDAAALKDGNFAFTRVGQWSIDSEGYIVDSNRNFLMGYTDGAANGKVVPGKTINPIKFTPVQQETLQNISVDANGVIKGINSDGKEVVLGAAAVARFQNPNGLAKSGSNTFTTSKTDNAGNITLTAPGGTAPNLMPGYVEASNVDLAKEFSDMIVTQRGFQANSKIITVSDEILQELVNMKR